MKWAFYLITLSNISNIFVETCSAKLSAKFVVTHLNTYCTYRHPLPLHFIDFHVMQIKVGLSRDESETRN